MGYKKPVSLRYSKKTIIKILTLTLLLSLVQSTSISHALSPIKIKSKNNKEGTNATDPKSQTIDENEVTVQSQDEITSPGVYDFKKKDIEIKLMDTNTYNNLKQYTSSLLCSSNQKKIESDNKYGIKSDFYRDNLGYFGSETWGRYYKDKKIRCSISFLMELNKARKINGVTSFYCYGYNNTSYERKVVNTFPILKKNGINPKGLTYSYYPSNSSSINRQNNSKITNPNNFNLLEEKVLTDSNCKKYVSYQDFLQTKINEYNNYYNLISCKKSKCPQVDYFSKMLNLNNEKFFNSLNKLPEHIFIYQEEDFSSNERECRYEQKEKLNTCYNNVTIKNEAISYYKDKIKLFYNKYQNKVFKKELNSTEKTDIIMNILGADENSEDWNVTLISYYATKKFIENKVKAELDMRKLSTTLLRNKKITDIAYNKSEFKTDEEKINYILKTIQDNATTSSIISKNNVIIQSNPLLLIFQTKITNNILNYQDVKINNQTLPQINEETPLLLCQYLFCGYTGDYWFLNPESYNLFIPTYQIRLTFLKDQEGELIIENGQGGFTSISVRG